MKQLLLTFIFGVFTTMANAMCKDLYNHQFTTLQGNKIDLCEYQTQPILIVNTASKCGFTPQFEALETMYSEFKDQGLLVVGFPSNDFRQELKTDQEIGDFCKHTYSVKFPMITKSAVTGEGANALYQQLANRTGQAPMWNFYKYLILPNSEKVYVFSSDVKPNSEAILGRVKGALK
jgi:glutathione peroxidase